MPIDYKLEFVLPLLAMSDDVYIRPVNGSHARCER